MKRSALIVSVLAGLLLAAGSLIAADTAVIHGVVKAGGSPLVGAKVVLEGPVSKGATTDRNGKFSFSGLPAGKYALVVTRAGYKRVRKIVNVAAGKTVRIVIELEPAPVPEEAEAEKKAEAAPSADMLATGRLAGPPPAAKPAPRPVSKAKISSESRAGGDAVVRAPPKRPKRTRRKYKGRPDRRARPSVAYSEPRAGDTEQYKDHGVRQWEFADKDRLSTFSIDVDTASYTIARRKLKEGRLPPPASVRTEEFVNYFRYNYPAPKTAPFNVAMEASPSPFEKSLHVLRIGVKGMEAKGKKRKPVHLTFLVDTSGSMNRPDKIGLVKRSLRFLVDQLKTGDTVALCTYAGSVREGLGPTGMNQRARIHRAIEDLMAGGSTAMSSGLELAYKLAHKNFRGKSVNRVIVCSDGDANVGRTSHGDMLKSIKHYAEEGITLSSIGFGMGNYKDHRMEQLANKGNGNYFYIDTFSAAKRVFGKQLMGTLQVIAKDVKIQVEFDPKAVRKYRLIGYENRDIADKDFRNDKVDAGEIGAGHTVTALYELQLTDPSRSFATVRIRWKKPQGVKADEKAFPFDTRMMRASFARASADFRRAVAAAALAENLRNSPFKESWTIQKAKRIAQKALSRESKEELELIELIDKAAALLGRK